MVISDMNPPFSTSFLTTWMMKIHNPWRALIISVNEYHVQQPLEANMVLVYYDQIRTQWVLSWVFWNFFKQIQNQQKVGIQDCILSPCIQIVFKNFENSRVNARNKITLKFHENCCYFDIGLTKKIFWAFQIFFR